MAIRIPHRSSASQSVGGKTIRIPNVGQQREVNLPSSNLLSNVPNISSSIDKIGNAVHRYALIKKARDEEIEKQRIKNINTKRKSLLANDIDNVNEDIKNNPNLSTDTTSSQFLSTDGDYENYYKNEVKKLEKKYRDLYKGDDDALAQFESDMYEIFRKGQKNMRTERRKKVVADAAIAHDIEEQLIDADVEALEVDVAWDAWPSIKKRIINLYGNSNKTFDKQLDVGKRLSEIEDKIWIKQVTAGHLVTDDMTGQVKVDYQAAFNFLNGAKSTDTWHGQKMSKERKRGLLKFLKEQGDLQDELKKETDAKIDNDNSVEINKILNEFSLSNFSSVPVGVNPKTWISDKVLNGKFTQKTKEAHIKTINKVFPDTHKDTQPTYGDATAIDEHFDQILIGNATDNVFVQRVNQDDRLTAKGKEMIIGWAADYNKNRSEYTNELVTNFMQQFDAVSSGYSEHVVGYLKSAKPMIWNELMRTKAEGEAAGISIHAMLGDTNSKHYVGWKFLEVYQTSVLQNMKDGSFQKMMKEQGVSAEQFWGAKRDKIYKAFFDVDNTTGAEGNQLAWIETPPKVDKEGNVIEQGKNVIDKKYAIFTQRLLNKPLPPERVVKDKTGQKETIEELIASHKWKKYKKEYRARVIRGEFNSDKIPTIKKYFSVTDMPTTKIKN